MDRNLLVEIEYADEGHETDDAYLFVVVNPYENGDDEFMDVWIPKSQIQNLDRDACTFEIPEWLATEKGLI